MKSKVIAQFSPLIRLTADLEANQKAKVKVGLLGDGGTRAGHAPKRHPVQGNARHQHAVSRGWIAPSVDQTNPEIGLEQEFGVISRHIPARSFLRVPLISELPKKLAMLGKQVWKVLINQQGILAALENLGAMGVQVVEVGFRTGGYGKWAPNAPLTRWIKGSSAPLIDSGQMRRAVSWAVVGGNKP